MDTVKNRVDFNGIDIWLGKDLNFEVDAEYVIGHSAGANCALLNWRRNKNVKLILIGPGIPKRNIFNWIQRIVKFWIFEGTEMSRERTECYEYFFSSIPKILKLLKADLMPIIYEIPRENLKIIRGKNDKFLFDEKIAKDLKGRGIEVIEIEEAGHNWHEKFNEEINRIIN